MSTPAEQFDRVAAAYATSGVHARGADLGMLAEMLRPHPEGRLLDLGTGAGHAALAVAPLVGHVYAVDVSQQMLATAARLAAERLVANISFHRLAVEEVSSLAPALAADGAEPRLDGAFTRYSAHHWHDFEAGVREAARVLKPSGVAGFADAVSAMPGANPSASARSKMTSRRRPYSPALDTFLNALELLHDPSHARDASIDEWRARLADAGFVVEATHTWKIQLDTDEWLARSATAPWRAEACRQLLRQASGAAREAFAILASGGIFSLPAALLLAHRPA